MTSKDIQKLFIELVQIPGESGNEKAAARFIVDYYKKLGWRTWQDDSGKQNGSNTGNVYALLEIDPKKPTLLFASHMDTVTEPGQTVNVVIEGDTITTDGTATLGADARAGVAAIIAASAALDKSQLKHNILCFFTTREESGLMGSTFFKPERELRYIFNVDAADDPGVFINKALGYQNFNVTINGKAAHAAKAYEMGVDAIRASGYLITKFPGAGDRKAGWTCNIGSVGGGTGMNVVPEKVVLRGEIRAGDEIAFDKVRTKIKDAVRATEAKFGALINLEFEKDSYIEPLAVTNDDSLLNFCKHAAKAAGLQPVFKKSDSTSDANKLCQYAPTVTLANGGKNAHSKDESIQINEIIETVELVKVLMLGQSSE
jgi:tripeptide aminopeptidase